MSTPKLPEQGQSQGQGRDRRNPDPEDPRKPDGTGRPDKRSWIYVLRKTWREFGDDQCTDLAAALTYYAVLAIFPADAGADLVAGRGRPGAEGASTPSSTGAAAAGVRQHPRHHRAAR